MADEYFARYLYFRSSSRIFLTSQAYKFGVLDKFSTKVDYCLISGTSKIAETLSVRGINDGVHACVYFINSTYGVVRHFALCRKLYFKQKIKAGDFYFGNFFDAPWHRGRFAARWSGCRSRANHQGHHQN
jgi:hypothetical protein